MDLDEKSITLIQHSQGRSKEIARHHARIKQWFDDAIHYTADTEYGSSGSPVFILGSDKVVAIHHMSHPRLNLNEGILMSQIVPEI